MVVLPDVGSLPGPKTIRTIIKITIRCVGCETDLQTFCSAASFFFLKIYYFKKQSKRLLIPLKIPHVDKVFGDVVCGIFPV
jgi:hypothetical protein